MSRDLEDGASCARIGAINGQGKLKTHSRAHVPVSAKGTSVDGNQAARGSVLSGSQSLSGLVRDDPRVVSALEEYLEALSAGRTRLGIW